MFGNLNMLPCGASPIQYLFCFKWEREDGNGKRLPFQSGYYHGKIKFPPDYPYKPPGISMITPNGRFATQKRICLSMSDFHPETWNPMWSVASILTGLLSFMMDNSPTTGSISTTVADKQHLAQMSLAYNCKSAIFRKMFPEYVNKYNQQQAAEQMNSERSSSGKDDGGTATALTLRNGGKNEVQGRGEIKAIDVRNRRGSKKYPFWLLVLLASMFGLVMALPLLQP
ncbi:ubiquitin-conjugating enzyme E2 34-like isoform X2 [Magnolia sinica]|uniref:ubiquitin-conjugating enzyme E2 34-like isoform X2 n=1 Tax=Magnolia sinica TaxID=86752 RepID=UPI00265A668E|nr:ubiquitin-conjugating enzyme E2 34-like isoform X2 [Magnolia sinica]